MHNLNSCFFRKLFNFWNSLFLVLFLLLFCIEFSFSADNMSLTDLKDSNTIQVHSEAQQQINSQTPIESDLRLDENEALESDITTKIYRSTDASGETLDGVETELDSALDADVINKEDLTSMYSFFTNKIIKRKVQEKNDN